MTDAQYLFVSDSREKKSVARSAVHRKGGEIEEMHLAQRLPDGKAEKGDERDSGQLQSELFLHMGAVQGTPG